MAMERSVVQKKYRGTQHSVNLQHSKVSKVNFVTSGVRSSSTGLFSCTSNQLKIVCLICSHTLSVVVTFSNVLASKSCCKKTTNKNVTNKTNDDDDISTPAILTI